MRLNTLNCLPPSQALLVGAGPTAAALSARVRKRTAELRAFRAAHDGAAWASAAQHAQAQRLSLSLPPAATHADAATLLAAKQPPTIATLARLYGLLRHDGPVPATEAAALQLVAACEDASATPSPPPGRARDLELDLAPMDAWHADRLDREGYKGLPPFSLIAAKAVLSATEVGGGM